MSDVTGSDLERFSEGAIEVAQGRIQGLNQAAQLQFPELAVGAEPPAFLSSPFADPEGSGSFAHNGSVYLFSRVSSGERELLLFRPAPQSTLTQQQLEGFIRQMRSLLQDIMLEFEAVSGPSRRGMDTFSRSFCRTYRLLSNLDFIRLMGTPEGVPFHPVTMDLAGLCRHLVQEAAFLLKEADIQLVYQSDLSSLLIPGDPDLLQKLLLTLLSNGAKAGPGGTVSLTVSSRKGRAIVTLGSRGEGLDDAGLEALLAQDMQPEIQIPDPRAGAGMGLAIARHIVSLHGGALLMEPRKNGVLSVVSLPLGTLDPRLSVRSPAEEAGGFSPVLMELSDVLPLSLFEMMDD